MSDNDMSGNIGILGGTFNPFHNGHMELADSARTCFDLQKILIMPNNIPAYKNPSDILSNNHRSNMIKLAIEDRPYMEYSDFELNRKGITYTADTLFELAGMYPKVKWYFIMGGDSVMYFDKWKRPQDILRYASLIVTTRDHVSKKDIEEKIASIQKQYGYGQIHTMDIPPVKVSSSEIRDRIKNGKSIRFMVPQTVEDYIYKNKLYM